jgi:hypothetical protein
VYLPLATFLPVDKFATTSSASFHSRERLAVMQKDYIAFDFIDNLTKHIFSTKN